MNHLSEDDLLGLVRGELPPDEARDLEEHTASCLGCRRELAWMRTERGLFRAQPIPLPAHTWQGIERRIIIAREEKSDRRRRFFTGGGAAVVFAAAASLLFYVWGRGVPTGERASGISQPQPTSEEPSKDDRERMSPSRVLDDAEHQYKQAITQLEGAYENGRDGLDPDTALRYDDELRHLRDVVVAERAKAGDDAWARRRVLRAYSAYMRSMQAMVLEVRK
jgi:hypothetical protein